MESRQAWGYLIVWEFYVPAEHRDAFEQNYGAEGTWALLFRRSQEYIATELVRDSSNPERYLTLDYWTAEGAFERFREENYEDYASLDLACEKLTRQETKLGTFTRAK